jgi:hypothetical protein
MALLRAEAEKLQLPLLKQGVIEEIITSDEMTFGVVPFKNISPNLIYEYNRENSLGSQDAEFIAPEGTATAESAATFTKKQDKPKVVIASVDVPRLLSNDPIQLATQLAKKSKQVAIKFSEQLIIGTGAGNGMYGLQSLVVAGQKINAGDDGAALSFAKLDEVLDMVKTGKPNAIIMPKRTRRSYKALLRAAGGVDSAMLQLPNYSRPVLTYEGIPIIVNDWVPTNQTVGESGAVCSSILAVYFNEEDGVTCIYNGQNIVDAIGPTHIPKSDRDNWDVVMHVEALTHSTLAIAELAGITN